MAAEDVDSLCVRSPDNVLYLSNFLPMKGYDIVVFPREGDATLLALEPSLDDARRTAWTNDVRLFKGYDERDPRPPTARRAHPPRRTAWTNDVRLFKGYDERDPRPPTARALELAQKVCRERGL